MATTVSQDREFLDTVINSCLLEAAIEWIVDNMEPEDVFGDKRMDSWAEDGGYVQGE